MKPRKRIAAATLVAAVLGVGAVVAYDPFLLVRAQFERQRVVAGLEADEAIDASALDLYAEKIPRAMKVWLDDCGHMSLVEQPDAVAAAVVALVGQDAQ